MPLFKNIVVGAVLLCSLPALAQKVKITGTISGPDGEPLPFSTISILDTRSGTSANENGFWRLNLDKGKYDLSFRSIGYHPFILHFMATKDTVVNVSLAKEVYMLDTVTIGKNEDPANRIMRHAIASRKKHLEEVKSYSADVYIKGVQKLVDAPKRFLGENVARVLDLDSNRRGILYLSESQSTLYFKRPDRYREVMIASKISGKNESLSLNKATDLNVNFYNNLIEMESLSIRGFVSPLAQYGFWYYRYRLLGTTIENGRLSYKIAVTPRRLHDPAFSGTIYISDGSWRLQAAELFLGKNAHINLVDTLRINQQFIPAGGDAWMPSSMQLAFKGNVLGFSFEGYFLSVYSNYNFGAKLSDQLFNGEILKITDDARKADEHYWEENRPVPLTPEEAADYQVKDAREALASTREFKDSVDQLNNQLTPAKALLLGYTKASTVHKTTYTFAPLLPSLFYNTVEGFGYQYQASFKKEYNLKNAIYLNTRLRYGLANHHFNPLLEARYYYDPVNLGFLSMKLGSEVLEVTNQRSSVSVTNSVNTLLYERNNSKFYEKRMIDLNGSYEAASGLFVSTGIEYSRRISLLNSSDYRMIDRKNKQFSSNNPFDPDHNTLLFAAHNAFVVDAELDYAPAARYVTRPEGKFYEPFKYPRLLLTYRKAFPFLGSHADFDFGSLELYQNSLNLGLLGKLSYTMKAGRFFNRKSLFFPDFYHFLGNNSLIFEASLRNFHYLDLYRYSSDRQFLEGHFEQNLGGFITNKIPLLRYLQLEEIIGGAYLDQPASKNYSELFFGLQRLVFRIDYALAFDGGQKVFQGFKFSYRLK
jgi:hypothetical protein